MWNLKKDTNELTKKKIIDIENRLIVTKEERGGGLIRSLK